MENDSFVLENLKTIVYVREKKESVYVLKPKELYEWASWSYEIGNRHQELMVENDELICLQEKGVKLLLDQLNLPYSEAKRSFTPLCKRSGHSH